jgi:hypothetical protein
MLTTIMMPALQFSIAGVVLLSCVFSSVSTASTTRLSEEDISSHGAKMIKKIPKDVINAPKPKRFSEAAKKEESAAATSDVEEIRVIGERDPEDVSPSKRAPMLAFRERLENDRPLTPWQKTQIGLCLIGLCGAKYGPEGIPVESKAFTRAEEQTDKSSLQLSKQFRGALQ